MTKDEQPMPWPNEPTNDAEALDVVRRLLDAFPGIAGDVERAASSITMAKLMSDSQASTDALMATLDADTTDVGDLLASSATDLDDVLKSSVSIDLDDVLAPPKCPRCGWSGGEPHDHDDDDDM